MMLTISRYQNQAKTRANKIFHLQERKTNKNILMNIGHLSLTKYYQIHLSMKGITHHDQVGSIDYWFSI